jgi:hypothetical protein
MVSKVPRDQILRLHFLAKRNDFTGALSSLQSNPNGATASGKPLPKPVRVDSYRFVVVAILRTPSVSVAESAEVAREQLSSSEHSELDRPLGAHRNSQGFPLSRPRFLGRLRVSV